MSRRVVIDANLLWSTGYRSSSAIGQFIILCAPAIATFYAPEYLKIELTRHFSRIVEASGRSASEVSVALEAAYSKVIFIADAQIPFEHYKTAIRLVRDIDLDDVAFVALNEYLEAMLWKGDVKLYDGLKAKVMIV